MYKVIVVMTIVLLAGCTPTKPSVGMANPASVYCVDIGGTVSIQDSAAGQMGVCTLPDGSTIEEWELFRRDNPQI